MLNVCVHWDIFCVYHIEENITKGWGSFQRYNIFIYDPFPLLAHYKECSRATPLLLLVKKNKQPEPETTLPTTPTKPNAQNKTAPFPPNPISKVSSLAFLWLHVLPVFLRYIRISLLKKDSSLLLIHKHTSYFSRIRNKSVKMLNSFNSLEKKICFLIKSHLYLQCLLLF